MKIILMFLGVLFAINLTKGAENDKAIQPFGMIHIAAALQNTTGNWVWQHSIDEQNPTRGHSTGKLESKSINISLEGLPGTVNVVFTPENAVYSHHMKLIGLHHDDNACHSYPKVEVYFNCEGREKTVQSSLILMRETYDKWTEKLYTPVEHQKVNSEYISDLSSLTYPTGRNGHFKATVKKKIAYRRPKLVKSGDIERIDYDLDDKESMYFIRAEDQQVTLIAQHLKFIDSMDLKNSSQWVKLFYNSNPADDKSTTVPFSQPNEYRLPFEISHKKVFLKYQYNHKKRQDRKVYGHFLNPDQIFPSNNLPASNDVSMIPLKGRND